MNCQPTICRACARDIDERGLRNPNVCRQCEDYTVEAMVLGDSGIRLLRPRQKRIADIDLIELASMRSRSTKPEVVLVELARFTSEALNEHL